jgi:gamma-butyrobetaine dioxygenase
MSGAWDFFADAPSRSRLRAELRSRGFSLVRPQLPELRPEAAKLAPWQSVAALFGEPAELVERQPIAPVPGGTSFASSSRHTPFHTDSQLFRGTPPGVQLMFCEARAARGGETLLLDAFALAAAIERSDPELFELLFDEERRIPFVFGDVLGPTLCLRGGALVFTHSPQPPRDRVATRLASALAAAPPIRFAIEPGELSVVDNHRMLHGRTAFEGERRFTRVLAWLRAPLGEHARYAARARAVAWTGANVGRGEAQAARRRRAVIEMLRGEPPGVLSTQYGIAEAELYRWRDAALAAVDHALARVEPTPDRQKETPKTDIFMNNAPPWSDPRAHDFWRSR